MSENIQEEKTAVLVIGSLGDVTKKIIELDLLVAEERYRATTAYFESVSLHKLVQEWPVIDEHKAFMLSKCMRVAIQKYKASEKELETLLANDDPQPFDLLSIRGACKDLFKYRNEIRFCIAELNKLSGGVGKA